MNRVFAVSLGFMFFTYSVIAQSKKSKNNDPKKVSIIEQSKSFKGYFDFYYHEETDKIFLKVRETEQEFLYVNSLSQGIGNNDIGLDRGQLGNERVVYFSKFGNKLLLILTC